jgi:hypothetical protein
MRSAPFLRFAMQALLALHAVGCTRLGALDALEQGTSLLFPCTPDPPVALASLFFLASFYYRIQNLRAGAPRL